MSEVMSSTASAQAQNARNLEEMADYLRDMLLERHASAEAALLAEALESIQRKLARSSSTPSQKRPAA